MVDPVTSRRWLYRSLFLGLCLASVYVNLLPVDPTPGGLPGPDLPVVIAYAWVLRRPDYVPVLLVALVMLMTDILFLRPIGLWSASVLVGLEILRAREPLTRDLPFLLEWATMGVVLGLVTAAYWLLLTLFLIDQPGFGALARQFVVNLAVFPPVIAVTRWGLGLKRTSPGGVDALGHRL